MSHMVGMALLTGIVLCGVSSVPAKTVVRIPAGMLIPLTLSKPLDSGAASPRLMVSFWAAADVVPYDLPVVLLGDYSAGVVVDTTPGERFLHTPDRHWVHPHHSSGQPRCARLAPPRHTGGNSIRRRCSWRWGLCCSRQHPDAVGLPARAGGPTRSHFPPHWRDRQCLGAAFGPHRAVPAPTRPARAHAGSLAEELTP